MKLPQKNRVPLELNEAMLVIELGFPPEVIDRMPDELINTMLIYKNVRHVAQYGGNYDP